MHRAHKAKDEQRRESQENRNRTRNDIERRPAAQSGRAIAYRVATSRIAFEAITVRRNTNGRGRPLTWSTRVELAPTSAGWNEGRLTHNPDHSSAQWYHHGRCEARACTWRGGPKHCWSAKIENEQSRVGHGRVDSFDGGSHSGHKGSDGQHQSCLVAYRKE